MSKYYKIPASFRYALIDVCQWYKKDGYPEGSTDIVFNDAMQRIEGSIYNPNRSDDADIRINENWVNYLKSAIHLMIEHWEPEYTYDKNGILELDKQVNNI